MGERFSHRPLFWDFEEWSTSSLRSPKAHVTGILVAPLLAEQWLRGV